jgi:diacylglycerol O-acyltransferase
MRRLSGVDALLLYSETPEIHMHTIKIGVLDVSGIEGGFSFEVWRQNAYPRLLALAPLRYQLVEIPFKLHHPMWRINADLDLDYHLQHVSVPASGGRRELDQLIGEIASTPLDRSRPLWQMYVADGLVDNRVAVIHKVHHALADGVASANQIAKALDGASMSGGRPASVDPDLATTDLLRAAAVDHVRQIRRTPNLIRQTARGIAQVRRRSRERGSHPDLARNFAPPPTFMNHVVTPRRTFATAPLALADVKAVGKRLEVTINDMVLAMAAGAVRELLLRYDGAADVPLIAGVPASFDPSPDRLSGNEFSYMMPSLPVHIADPLERVRISALSADVAKENHRLLGPTVMAEWMCYLPPAVAPVGFRYQSKRVESAAIMNLTISNVPGPRAYGHIDGARLSEIYSVGPLVPGSGLNITVWSYVDQFNISVLADDATVDDPHEVADAMLGSFAEIRAAAGFTGEPTRIDAVLPATGADR